MNLFKEMLDDVNHAIVTEELLEDDINIEMLETAMDNWKELITQIRREQKSDKDFAQRNELDEVTQAEFGLSGKYL